MFVEFYKFSGIFIFLWLLDHYWEVLNQLSESLTHKKCFQSFLPFFKLFSSLFQDCAVFSTQFSWKLPVYRVLREGTFQNFAYFGISMDIHLYALQLVYSLSKYCTCISWRRPVSARFKVPRRPVSVWTLSGWEFFTKLASDYYHFLCFQFSKAIYSLSQLEV